MLSIIDCGVAELLECNHWHLLESFPAQGLLLASRATIAHSQSKYYLLNSKHLFMSYQIRLNGNGLNV